MLLPPRSEFLGSFSGPRLPSLTPSEREGTHSCSFETNKWRPVIGNDRATDGNNIRLKKRKEEEARMRFCWNFEGLYHAVCKPEHMSVWECDSSQRYHYMALLLPSLPLAGFRCVCTGSIDETTIPVNVTWINWKQLLLFAVLYMHVRCYIGQNFKSWLLAS